MTDIDEEEKPLDPAVERVRRKMVRLLTISIGIMMIGLLTVLSAVVYKITTSDSRKLVEASIDLPQGAKLVSSSLGTDKTLITVELPSGQMQLMVIDLQTGETSAIITLK